MLPAAGQGTWMVPMSGKTRSPIQLISAVPWKAFSAQPSWVSAFRLTCHSDRTHNAPALPFPEPFRLSWSGLKSIFPRCMPAFPPDPLPGDMGAHPASEIDGGSYHSSQPPPQTRNHKGCCLSITFLLPVSREQLYRKDAENPCEAPRKRY